MRALTGLAIAGGLLAGQASAVTDYDACIALIASDPVQAEIEAGDWARFDGGAAARHCYALALIETGAQSHAIDELIGIAMEETDIEDAERADILAQAGNLLLQEGDPVTANVVAQQALRLNSRNSTALVLRARLKLEAGEPRAAIRDLDAALQVRPGKVDFLLLRASAHRQLNQHVQARDDAAFASEQAPGDAEAWLELGLAEAALYDKPAARRAFLEAIALDREGLVGKSAQLALQRMDVGIED